MRILIIHQNFPGQFHHMAETWAARPGWEVLGIGRDTCPGSPHVRCIRYRLHRDAHAQQHAYLRSAESAVLHGQAVARVLLQLKRMGFKPDAIVAHPGWGETLYAKDVFPDARLVHLCEWFYSAQGADVNFDPEFPTSFDDHARIRTWNAMHLLNLENCDVGISPTQWQKSRHPLAYQSKIVVAHEGIDTGQLMPDSSASITVTGGRQLTAKDPIVTYVARNLEPYRGFHRFMRALAAIQEQHKTCHAVIVGGDGVSYGRRPEHAANWREELLREVPLDSSRIHFLGKVPYDQYRRVLQVSSAHVYLTYPFVLSWSVLEAMASGCVVVGSRTSPVEEVLRDFDNGVLVDFFDEREIADRTVQILRNRAAHRSIGERARADVVEHFNRASGLRSYDAALAGHAPAEAPRSA